MWYWSDPIINTRRNMKRHLNVDRYALTSFLFCIPAKTVGIRLLIGFIQIVFLWKFLRVKTREHLPEIRLCLFRG